MKGIETRLVRVTSGSFFCRFASCLSFSCLLSSEVATETGGPADFTDSLSLKIEFSVFFLFHVYTQTHNGSVHTRVESSRLREGKDAGEKVVCMFCILFTLAFLVQYEKREFFHRVETSFFIFLFFF